MTVNGATAVTNLGFLTILHEPSGYIGGYLVTNQWGRPVEFRLSTAVQPNRIQQILYGDTLQPYLCADLIGLTLIEKSNTQTQVIFTDTPAALDLRLRLTTPIVGLSSTAVDEHRNANGSNGTSANGSAKVCELDNSPTLRETVDRLREQLDLTEPFTRIRAAINEARKMGVTSRG